MKKNSLIFVLVVIILILVGYIIFDKIAIVTNNEKIEEEETITLIDSISLSYVDIYLTSDGNAYIVPLTSEEIETLSGGNNLKERLSTLYERAFYYDIYITNNKLKGFKVNVDDDVTKIRKVEIEEYIYIIFIKENHTIGLFNYDEYYNLLYTNVSDNYNDYKNIQDIKDNKIIYLDGSKDNFELMK